MMLEQVPLTSYLRYLELDEISSFSHSKVSYPVSTAVFDFCGTCRLTTLIDDARCSSKGCTNQARTGGVCIRHGAPATSCAAAQDAQDMPEQGECAGDMVEDEMGVVPGKALVVPSRMFMLI